MTPYIDSTYIKLVRDFTIYVSDVENQYNNFDKTNPSSTKQLEYLISTKIKIFKDLDSYFMGIWEIVKSFENREFLEHQNYLLENVQDILLNPIEINKYIHDKPLGQPGDYVMLNYIYDYFDNSKFLGNTTFQKLINNYTCNIPIAYSNNLRKSIFKEKIISICNKGKNPKILSFGCGAAREIIEISNEDIDIKLSTLDLLESQKDALNYIEKRINSKKTKLTPFLDYQVIDYVEIIRKPNKVDNLKHKYDLIYCPGIFDYLTKRMAQKLIEYLFQNLNSNGQLIICNANKKSEYHRAYYEMIGGWKFIHRDNEEIMEWVDKIQEPKETYFSDESKANCYTYLNILRK